MPDWWPEKKLGSAAVILDDRRRVLLVKHSYGRLNWELPGGAVEAGEGVVEGAIREAHEETGLRVVAEHLTGIYYDADVDALHFVFLCKPRGAASVPRPDAEEVTDCMFRHPDDLPRPISDFTVRRVEEAVSGSRQPFAHHRGAANMAGLIEPFAKAEESPAVSALPKADLHVHQEWFARLDRMLARREGRKPYDWRRWARRLMEEVPPSMPRLERLATVRPVSKETDTEPENFVARVEDLLEAAGDGAVPVEVRFGSETVLRPGFMELFREAERRVQARYPRLRAEAIVSLFLWYEPERLERLVDACLREADRGLAGIDLLYELYDTEAEWKVAYRVAGRAADAGLGVTAHAGEFSTANIQAALEVPGLTRIGHAVYAAHDPRLLESLAVSGVTVECCPSCNVVLGAVPSYEEHPIRRFVEHGVPVVLCTDDPVQVCTTIGREYAIASALGFSTDELLGFTANAVRASFTTPERRTELLSELQELA